MANPSTDYHAYFHKMRDIHLAVPPTTGQLAYLLARGARARTAVEFGTSFGVSTIYLAAAMRDTGGGRVIGTELEPEKAGHARANLREAGLEDLVEIREGDALETLARDLPDSLDNADSVPEYRAAVRAPGSGYLSLPFGEEVELTMKL